MQVVKWEGGLAVALPADVVEGLGLKQGEEVEVTLTRPASQTSMYGLPPISREEAIERIRNGEKWSLPPDYRFDREEANAR